MAGYTLHLKGVFFFQGRSIFCTSSPAAERWKQQTLFLDSLFITHTSSIFDTSPLKTLPPQAERYVLLCVMKMRRETVQISGCAHTNLTLDKKTKWADIQRLHYLHLYSCQYTDSYYWTKTLSSLLHHSHAYCSLNALTFVQSNPNRPLKKLVLSRGISCQAVITSV